MLHALSAIKLSQLMDRDRWDFKNLEKQQIIGEQKTEEERDIFAEELF
jgi:hypothetical protein